MRLVALPGVSAASLRVSQHRLGRRLGYPDSAIPEGRPRELSGEARRGFEEDADPWRRAVAVGSRTRVGGWPANRAGVGMRRRVMRELASLGVPIISGEIYHGLAYGGGEHTILNDTSQAFVLNGFSKYFAMTGWRLGYLIFPPEVRATLMKLHQNIMISASEHVQYAGIAAMREAIPVCERSQREYDRRRLFIIYRRGDSGRRGGGQQGGREEGWDGGR